MISPLLANIYLHAMDSAFHQPDGPSHFANARLVRYADDFVVLARWIGPRITRWLEETLETKLGLRINREKTSVVDLCAPGASLDFLGFTVRRDRHLHGGPGRYVNVFPSQKAVQRLRGKTRAVFRNTTRAAWVVLGDLNRLHRTWKRYFGYGYPRAVYRDQDHYVLNCFQRYLRRKSQRRARPVRQGDSLYRHIRRQGYQSL